MRQKVGDKEFYLLPCPFCDADVAEFATVWDTENCGNFQEEVCPNYVNPFDEDDFPEGECSIHLVVCPANKKGCGASTGWCISLEQAAQKWNRRPRYGQ